MKTDKRLNLDLLHEELSSLPGAVSTYPENRKAGVRVNYSVLLFPDGSTEIRGLPDADVEQVIQKHDPDKKSKSQQRKEERAQARVAVLQKLNLTEEELQDLLS